MVRGARPSVTAGGPPLPECAGSLPGPCLDRERPGPRAAPGIAGEDAECAGQRGGRQAAKFSPGRGRWALLLLQLHLLRALAQGAVFRFGRFPKTTPQDCVHVPETQKRPSCGEFGVVAFLSLDCTQGGESKSLEKPQESLFALFKPAPRF
ncbi:protein sidekick-1 isoform X1 [Oryctolagus cuniculus]|uniref:protein sidekick-1 isoform X1 n=1 Tax=Oryctolagus cuniculus TaxID=9986 RepID=UPI00387A1C9A